MSLQDSIPFQSCGGNELRELMLFHSPGPKLVPASDAIKSAERAVEEEAKEVRESKAP
jgi:hypothetical protein